MGSPEDGDDVCLTSSWVGNKLGTTSSNVGEVVSTES